MALPNSQGYITVHYQIPATNSFDQFIIGATEFHTVIYRINATECAKLFCKDASASFE
jgi:hypothetical protein